MQQYEAAENHFKGRNVSNLVYLSRAWYAYATRDLNYSAMGKSLAYAQRVRLPLCVFAASLATSLCRH